MPYIGTQPPLTPFLATQAQSFSGNGSTTTFTLSRAVSELRDIEVLVNNVQQSPYDASYSVVGGTSLVFSEAPSAGTNNIYVIFRGLAIGTAIDSGAYRKAEVDALVAGKQNALGYTPVNKAGDTMTGALQLPSIRLQSGGGLTVNDSSGVDAYLSITSTGRVTTPYQPIFLGVPTTDYSGGGMPTGTMAITAAINNGNCFSAATSQFTAPVAGYYKTTWGGLQLTATVTSLQRNGADVYSGNHWAGSGPSYITMTQTSTLSLAAGDTLRIRQWNGGGYYSAWYIWSVELIG